MTILKLNFSTMALLLSLICFGNGFAAPLELSALKDMTISPGLKTAYTQADSLGFKCYNAELNASAIAFKQSAVGMANLFFKSGTTIKQATLNYADKSCTIQAVTDGGAIPTAITANGQATFGVNNTVQWEIVGGKIRQSTSDQDSAVTFVDVLDYPNATIKYIATNENATKDAFYLVALDTDKILHVKTDLGNWYHGRCTKIEHLSIDNNGTIAMQMVADEAPQMVAYSVPQNSGMVLVAFKADYIPDTSIPRVFVLPVAEPVGMPEDLGVIRDSEMTVLPGVVPEVIEEPVIPMPVTDPVLVTDPLQGETMPVVPNDSVLVTDPLQSETMPVMPNVPVGPIVPEVPVGPIVPEVLVVPVNSQGSGGVVLPDVPVGPIVTNPGLGTDQVQVPAVLTGSGASAGSDVPVNSQGSGGVVLPEVPVGPVMPDAGPLPTTGQVQPRQMPVTQYVLDSGNSPRTAPLQQFLAGSDVPVGPIVTNPGLVAPALVKPIPDIPMELESTTRTAPSGSTVMLAGSPAPSITDVSGSPAAPAGSDAPVNSQGSGGVVLPDISVESVINQAQVPAGSGVPATEEPMPELPPMDMDFMFDAPPIEEVPAANSGQGTAQQAAQEPAADLFV